MAELAGGQVVDVTSEQPGELDVILAGPWGMQEIMFDETQDQTKVRFVATR